MLALGLMLLTQAVVLASPPARPTPDRQLSENISSLNRRLQTALTGNARPDPDVPALLHERAEALFALAATDPRQALQLAFPREQLEALRTAYPNSLDDIELVATGVRVLAGGAVCDTKGEQRMAVLLVSFPGLPLPSTVTVASVRDAIFGKNRSLDGYLRDASYGRAWAAGDVFGPFALDRNYDCEGLEEITKAAANAASSQIDLTRFNRIMIFNPWTFQTGCGGAVGSMACWNIPLRNGTQLTASTSMVSFGPNDSLLQRTGIATHEFGHNIGLGHSKSLAFGAEPLGPFGQQGKADEYGDSFSVMGQVCYLPDGGGNTGHFAAQQKVQLGWLDAARAVTTVERPGLYRVEPMSAQTGGVKALRIRRGTGNNAWPRRKPPNLSCRRRSFKTRSGPIRIRIS